MPKVIFYAGTAFCLFVALTSAGEAARELQDGTLAFAALPRSVRGSWAIGVALIAGLANAALFLRMASLLAARNLFAAFVSVVSVAGAFASLTAVLFIQWRLIVTLAGAGTPLAEIHLAAFMVLGFFVSLSALSLRPYFSIQASRVLSALVFFPLPLFALVMAQELFVRSSPAPLPASTPASQVFFAVQAILFFSIAVHCIRHRHLFLEMTNLRELLDARVDPAARPGRTIGDVAFDS